MLSSLLIKSKKEKAKDNFRGEAGLDSKKNNLNFYKWKVEIIETVQSRQTEHGHSREMSKHKKMKHKIKRRIYIDLGMIVIKMKKYNFMQ